MLGIQRPDKRTHILNRPDLLQDRCEVRDREQHVGAIPGGKRCRGLGIDLAPVLRFLLDHDVGMGGVEGIQQFLNPLDTVRRLLHVPQHQFGLCKGRTAAKQQDGKGQA